MPMRASLLLLLLAATVGCGRQAPPAGEEVDVVVHADGTVELQGPIFEALRVYVGESPPEIDRALQPLRAAFVRAAAAAPRDRYTASSLPLHLELDPRARWQHVLWILQAAAVPEARLWDVRLRLAGQTAWQTMPLPRDPGLSDAGAVLGDVMLPPFPATAHVLLRPPSRNLGGWGVALLLPPDGKIVVRHELPTNAAEEASLVAVLARAFAYGARTEPLDLVALVCERPGLPDLRCEAALRAYALVRRAWSGPLLWEEARPPLLSGR